MERKLKILIVIEIILTAAAVVSEFVLRSYLPPELRNYLDLFNEDLSTIEIIPVVLLLLVFVLLIVSWIQLWRLKRDGRTLFAAAWGCSLPLMIPLGPYVEPGLTYALDISSAIVAGMILGIAYFSDLRSRFN
jgi:hypothetical protein